MSDIKLFKILDGRAAELEGSASDLEKPLQTLIERNLEVLLSIRFLATEYSTGKLHGGRIDSLGLDEDGCPVIVEYKRSISENVINQGLYYLDWLMDHQADFKLLVMRQLGSAAAESIDWSAPRLVCIANDFTKYDSHAVQQIGRNIDLVRYRRFGEELLLLEQASTNGSGSGGSLLYQRVGKSVASGSDADVNMIEVSVPGKSGGDKTYADVLQTLSPDLRELLNSVENYLLSLGDDVQLVELKHWIAFKRLKNFASISLQKSRLLLHLHVTPSLFVGVLSGARDVSKLGHSGSGGLEVPLYKLSDLEAAKPAIGLAYEGKSVTAAENAVIRGIGLD